MEKSKVKFELEELLRKFFIIFCLIFLILSTWGAYNSLNEAISVWINYKFAPLYRALLNLAVLTLAACFLNLLLRR